MLETPEKENPIQPTAPEMNGGPAPSTAMFVARASALLAGATLLSRLLGLVREMLVARYYGATGQTDCFAFALVVPELLRTLMISGAVASVFVPLMTQAQKCGNKEESKRLAGVMLSFVSFIAVGVIIFGEIFAPQLVMFSEWLQFSGNSLDPEKIALTAQLIRIMLPIVLLVGLWGLMGGILNTFDNFHTPGFAPIAWNGAIIVIVAFLGVRGRIQDVAWAFVIGHAIQALWHLPALMKIGIRPMAIDWKHPMLGKFLLLAPAAVLAYAAPAVNAFIGQGIALNLEESAASSLMYAFRIQQLPMAVFGVSVATALFPTLSRHASTGSAKNVVNTLASGIRMTALSTIPAIVFFLVLPTETIALIYERGKFTHSDTLTVSIALYWFSWAIIPMSLLLLTARTFFSDQDTKTPAVLGIATIVIYYILAVTMTKMFGFPGLPMSNALVAWIFLSISAGIIHRRYSVRDRKASLMSAIGMKSPMQMIIAGGVEAIVLLGYKYSLGEVHGTMNLMAMLAGAIVIGAGVYLGILKLMKNPDLSMTLSKLIRRR